MDCRDGTIDWDAGPGHPDREADPPPGSASALVQILDDYLADLQAGRAPDRARLLADHPELADRLESCLAGIEFIHRTTAAEGVGGQPARLGEFLIRREIGRGGMGVVYEAEQTTLRRRVALKVLRFGIVADEGAMQRFTREAETVARLHHTNIVPIFAVGSEQGVHYYAMQFIEGRNLAEVLAEAADRGGPPGPADVAGWGVQAAEALEYAHRRGVIHRDVKPSNLLLDPEGVVWLTDFGLAKRADEATLTVAGTLMGTPRYMSPEQAESVRRPVDHRTDIYSLGASLYELATGRPVFEDATPLGVIRRILADEPVPPRQVRPGLPRDLETVILSCLAKDPDRRYPTAQALADDLRAVLDGRPIQARRIGPIGRAARWVRRQRRSVAVAAAAAVATTILVGGSALAWTATVRLRQATVMLTTSEPHLAAEILDADDGRVLVEGTSLPTRQPLALPAGAYRVRLSTPGRPTEAFDLQLRRGESRQFGVGLGPRQLWEPIATSPSETLYVVELEGRADLVQLTSLSMRRIDGETGRTLWQLDPRPPVADDGGAAAIEAANEAQARRMRAFQDIAGIGEGHPGPIRPAPDLDGDGIGDLVWPGRHAPLLWAVSGREGEPGRGRELWMFDAGGEGAVVGTPAVADVDGDGTPDVIATFRSEWRPWVMGPASGWVQAVSGRDGGPLWRFDLPEPIEAGGPSSGRLAARVGPIGEGLGVVVVAGASLHVLDAGTGEPEWSHELAGQALREPELADLDGDGQLDALLVVEGPAGHALVALAPATRRVLWTRALPVLWGRDVTSDADPDWPLVVDLDGDGAAEVIVPTSSTAAGSTWIGVEALRGADGRSAWAHRLGASFLTGRWTIRLLAGPDLDGDGHRELFVGSTLAERGRDRAPAGALYVDALSGRDGRGFWWWRRPTVEFSDRVGPLHWWGTGPDGWPRLVVELTTWPEAPMSVFTLSAGTGTPEHEVPGAFAPIVADLDGDGTPDLGYRTSDSESTISDLGRLHAVRGRPPEPWGRLGLFEPVADLDGDGLDDLLEAREDGLTAVSGRDGRILWTGSGSARGDLFQGTWTLLPAPAPATGADLDAPGGQHADLDGDGTPDLLVGLVGGIGYSRAAMATVPVPIRAVSGRSGKTLWTAPEIANPAADPACFVRPRSVRCADLDGDGTPEVVAVVHIQATLGAHRVDRLELMTFSGADGGLRWRQTLSDLPTSRAIGLDRFAPEPRLANLDADGDLDLVLAAPLPTPDGFVGVELRAFGGRDGRTLWSYTLPSRAPLDMGQPGAILPELALGQLDEDGVPDLAVLYESPRIEDGRFVDMGGPRTYEVACLDGRTGRPLGTPRAFRDERPGFGGPPRPVLLDLDGQGRHAIALIERDREATRILLIDGRGQEIHRREFPPGDMSPWPDPLFARDLDGDGADEVVALLRLGEPTVQAFRGDLGGPIWSRTLEDAWRLLDVRAAGAGRPACVELASPSSRLLGLDGPTGRVAWRGQGRGRDSVATVSSRAPLLRDASPGGLPRVVSHAYSSTVCLMTVPAGSAGEGFAPANAPASTCPGRADPRLVRPLPWADPSGEALLLMVGAALSCLVLVVLPALAIARVVRSRPLGLARLLLVPAILAAPIVVARAVAPGLPPGVPAAPWVASGLPTLVLAGMLMQAIARRQWRRLALLAGLSAAVGVALGAALLGLDSRRMAPWQHYSWDHWYWIAAPATYGVGALATIGLALAACFRLVRRGVRRASRGPQPV